MNTFEPNSNLNEKQAAAYLGISVSSLRKSRMNGLREGFLPPPPYVKIGRRVVYRMTDLHRFLDSYLQAAV